MDVPDDHKFIGFDAYQKAMDCLKPGDVAIFATPPALHRFPKAMAGRVQEVCRALVEHYDIQGVDHGYDLMRGDPELVRRVYTFLALHVERAVTA